VLDEALVVEARRAAERLLSEDPEAAARHIDRWLGGRAHYLNA
jgi:ATP-dependent DNA helicase RecG